MKVLEVKIGNRFNESIRIGELMKEYGAQIRCKKVVRDGNNLIGCGQRSHVYKKEFVGGKVVPLIIRYTCKSRACPPCNEMRLRGFRKRLDSIIQERGEKNFIFLTVTSRGRVSVEGVRKEFDFISKELSNLFRTKIVKETIVGGFRALEGNSDSEGMINPHSHILLETSGEDLSENKSVLKFLKSDAYQDRLKEYLENNPLKTKEQIFKSTCTYLKRGRFTQLIWSALLYSRGLGSVCNVQEVSKFKNPGKSTSEELCKYMTKFMKLSGNKLPQFILAMKGKRAFSCWGSLKLNKSELDKVESESSEDNDQDQDQEEFTLSYVGTIKEVAYMAFEQDDSFCQLAIGLALNKNFIEIELEGD